MVFCASYTRRQYCCSHHRHQNCSILECLCIWCFWTLFASFSWMKFVQRISNARKRNYKIEFHLVDTCVCTTHTHTFCNCNDALCNLKLNKDISLATTNTLQDEFGAFIQCIRFFSLAFSASTIFRSWCCVFPSFLLSFSVSYYTFLDVQVHVQFTLKIWVWFPPEWALITWFDTSYFVCVCVDRVRASQI